MPFSVFTAVVLIRATSLPAYLPACVPARSRVTAPASVNDNGVHTYTHPARAPMRTRAPRAGSGGGVHVWTHGSEMARQIRRSPLIHGGKILRWSAGDPNFSTGGSPMLKPPSSPSA